MKKSHAPTKVSKSWHMRNVLKKIDVFGEPLPAFNVKGETVITTLTGGIVTFLMIIIFLTYGSLKFIDLIENPNPLIVEVTENDVFELDDVFNLDEIGFKFAFTIENYLSSERRDDSAYVKYLARYYIKKDGIWGEKLLSYHECDETDWIDFAPPAKEYKG